MTTLEIKSVTNKAEFEDFLQSQQNAPFLQSWNSAEQYEAMGDKTLRLGLYEEGSLVGVALVIQVRAKRGNYLYLPYGPVLKFWKKEHLKALTDYLVSWGRGEGFDFIRVAPFVEKNDANYKLFKENGYRVSPIHMLAEVLWVLDISPSEEELLMGMRKTTRNLIRRAKKDGVIVKQETSKEAVDKFIKLHDETKERHQFVAYPNKLFYEQVKHFTDDDQVKVMIGSYNDEVLAASIVMFYGDSGSYHHGASTPTKVPVSYLNQWESILEAKRRDLKLYNFWGIEETEDKKHPFYGITRFKQGFGGEIRYLLPAHDIIVSKKYWINFIIETVRRIRRGFGWKRL